LLLRLVNLQVGVVILLSLFFIFFVFLILFLPLFVEAGSRSRCSGGCGGCDEWELGTDYLLSPWWRLS